MTNSSHGQKGHGWITIPAVKSGRFLRVSAPWLTTGIPREGNG